MGIPWCEISVLPAVFAFLHLNVVSATVVQDLGGDTWTAIGTRSLSSVALSVSKATVPGCIHTDWYRTLKPTKENDPYYRFNDVSWRPIAEHNWLYRRVFHPTEEILNKKEQWLICEGLDTIANVSVNGKLLGSAKNMFLRYAFNVTGILQMTFNQVDVAFDSALNYANLTHSAMPYPIPPECPPDVQHGFCHINMLRKEQCSFSWDWGPGFATQGIWKPIYLLGYDDIIMTDMTASYDWDLEVLFIKARFRASGAHAEFKGTLDVFVNELLPAAGSSFKIVVPKENPIASVNQKIPKTDFKLWWPNGKGDQNLYNITVKFQPDDSNDVSFKTVWFGFRKVELVQQPINGSSGLGFYFKINGQPIFAKGSNWIPADAFLNRLTTENYTNLLQSAKDANMNMLRVWGGGVYERDEFYEIADRSGIMIWHDFMFACALYPTNKEFLTSVSQEVNDTLWRLKHHPSIVVWAGNNENEAALATDWYNTTADFNRYKKDYVELYVNTIRNVVTASDNTRPFLTSSPTNGVETETEGWVAKNPYDTHYGDTHYYNYNNDCLDWTKYPKTRFASEYGFQSWPSIETLKPVSVPEDLFWKSNFSQHRNHHADGNEQIVDQIFKHFTVSNSLGDIEQFESLVYLSQVVQALCYKSETEFYRRSRSEIVNGEGHTMGALYWQLNDIWQAPSWSSIEYGGKWKAVHYFAKKFFANVALSAYGSGTDLTVYSLSDIDSPIEPVTLVIDMHTWNEFDVKHTWQNAIYISPQSSKMQYRESISTLMQQGGCEQKEFCYFVIYLKEVPDVDPTFFYPVPFKDIVGLKNATIQVIDIGPSNTNSTYTFDITLSTSVPSFFVWIEAVGIRGRFSDNAFLFYHPKKVITFYAWEIVDADRLKSSLRFKSLSDVQPSADRPSGYRQTDHDYEDEEFSNATELEEMYWLGDIAAQVALGIFGSFFLLICAVLVAYVVARSNSHVSGEHKTIVQTQPKARSRSVSSKTPFLINDELAESAIDTNTCGAFKLNLKNGYGHDAKNVEIKFYVT